MVFVLKTEKHNLAGLRLPIFLYKLREFINFMSRWVTVALESPFLWMYTLFFIDFFPGPGPDIVFDKEKLYKSLLIEYKLAG